VRGVDGVFEGGPKLKPGSGFEGGDGLQVVGLLGVAQVVTPSEALASAVSKAEDVPRRPSRACSGVLPARVSILATWATYWSRSLTSLSPVRR
jgi:hypothetical protein